MLQMSLDTPVWCEQYAAQISLFFVLGETQHLQQDLLCSIDMVLVAAHALHTYLVS